MTEDILKVNNKKSEVSMVNTVISYYVNFTHILATSKPPLIYAS